jgi:hypothetical protein
VNIYVCHQEPYWPDEEKARRDRACLGPLVNDAGQYLTGQIVHQLVEERPSPLPALAPVGPTGRPTIYDRVRGVSASLDQRGFMWVQGLWLSKSTLQTRAFAAFRPPQLGRP